MNRLKVFFYNLRLLFARELPAVFEEQERKLNARVDDYEQRVDTRADNYERALDGRLAERSEVVDQRLDARFTAIELRLDERHLAQELATTERATLYEAALDERLDERLTSLEKLTDTRFELIEQRNEDRLIAIELQNDQRQATIEEHNETRLSAIEDNNETRLSAIEYNNETRLTAIELRNEERQGAIEQRNDAQIAELTQHLNQRVDDHLRTSDNRFDDRFARAERVIDERFEALEKRADERMERHEKRTDYNLKLNRADILDRTDVMLQIFEQRLDQQRRELKALREQLSNQTRPAAAGEGENPAANGHHEVVVASLTEGDPAQQIQSFRKLAQSSGLIGKSKLPTTDATLYQKILDWKKVSTDKLNDFTPDEQEIVDYMLSFISDPAERSYTQQHLRRFLSTLQRIPPPQRSTDRLLELGSLLHFVPAIKKFCGYGEVCGADFWEGDEKLTHETLTQTLTNGHTPETHTIELRNFNVEADPFPYPDGHFRVVLCCELLEHLQRDPLHLLWECNRVLMDDGFLLLTTPNIASARSLEGVLIGCAPYLLSQYNLTSPADQHNREYAPYEVGLALAAAGFTVVELETEDVWLRSNPAILKLLEEVNLPTDMRGDNIFALARKTSAPVERYPKEFYIA
jgi:SAM-dependent methyltransferase